MKNSNKTIRPAQRVEEIQEYYFSRKLKEIARMNAQGLDVISLGVGGPDRPPHAVCPNCERLMPIGMPDGMAYSSILPQKFCR